MAVVCLLKLRVIHRNINSKCRYHRVAITDEIPVYGFKSSSNMLMLFKSCKQVIKPVPCGGHMQRLDLFSHSKILLNQNSPTLCPVYSCNRMILKREETTFLGYQGTGVECYILNTNTMPNKMPKSCEHLSSFGKSLFDTESNEANTEHRATHNCFTINNTECLHSWSVSQACMELTTNYT